MSQPLLQCRGRMRAVLRTPTSEASPLGFRAFLKNSCFEQQLHASRCVQNCESIIRFLDHRRPLTRGAVGCCWGVCYDRTDQSRSNAGAGTVLSVFKCTLCEARKKSSCMQKSPPNPVRHDTLCKLQRLTTVECAQCQIPDLSESTVLIALQLQADPPPCAGRSEVKCEAICIICRRNSALETPAPRPAIASDCSSSPVPGLVGEFPLI